MGRVDIVTKDWDVFKQACLMADREAAYLLLGIENHATVHYAMPVKNMSYDALQYAGQVTAIAKRHRKENDYAGHSGGEYLSGFYKEDRLLPVITLAVYFGPDRWDGPLSLHEMLSERDPKLLSLVQDYKIHLIQPALIEPEDFEKLHSSLREVLSFIKYSQDKEKLAELLRTDGQFRILDREAAQVIRACTNIEMEIDEESEGCNVCKVIDDMMRESREEGMEKGRKEGMEEERVNTERERKRADLAEEEVRKLRKELERYQKGA